MARSRHYDRKSSRAACIRRCHLRQSRAASLADQFHRWRCRPGTASQERRNRKRTRLPTACGSAPRKPSGIRNSAGNRPSSSIVQKHGDQAQAVVWICGIFLSQIAPARCAMVDRDSIAKDSPPIGRQVVIARRHAADVVGFVRVLSGMIGLHDSANLARREAVRDCGLKWRSRDLRRPLVSSRINGVYLGPVRVSNDNGLTRLFGDPLGDR